VNEKRIGQQCQPSEEEKKVTTKMKDVETAPACSKFGYSIEPG